MNVPPSFVEIEYLDGSRKRVNQADVKLLINKNNENKRKYVHYWTPAGDSEPSDFSNMDSLKKFRVSPANMKQKGLYYCKLIEKSQPTDESLLVDSQNSQGTIINDPIEQTFFKPENMNCDITESHHSENEFNDSVSTWDTANQHASDEEWTSKSDTAKKAMSEKKKNTIPKCLFPKYFSVSEFVDGKITAQCNLCARSNVLKFVRSYGTVTSNLLAHMKRGHPYEYEEYRKRNDVSSLNVYHSPKKAEKILAPSIQSKEEPTIFRYYFTKIALMGDKIRGQCNFCTSTICARKGITSNFVTHLKRKHPKRHKEYATKMLTKRSRRIQSSDYYVEDSTNSPQNSIEEVTVPEFDDDPMTENTHLNQTGTTGWDDDESNHHVSVATFGMNKFGNDVKTFPTTDLFERFFDVVETVEDEMKAECNLCADRGNCKPGMAIITGDSTKTVFKDHVKQLHPLSYIEYLEDYTNIEPKNETGKVRPTISQETLSTAVTEYVINEMLPHSTIESACFRKFIKNITGIDPEIVLKADALKSEIEERFERKKDQLIEALDNVKHVCVTADIWTIQKDVYIGSTLHWLEPISLQRKSAPFMRRRLKSHENIEQIAEQLISMCEKYRIKKKIVAIVTDSGWNFGNAFKEFGVSMQESAGVCEFHEIDFNSKLPSINKCSTVTHMLSQITTRDAANALADASYSEIHTSVFEKLKRFWQKTKESPTEIGAVIRPTDGRSNSLFESLHFIVNKGIDAINEMHTQFRMPLLTSRDHKFLAEFVQIAKPVAAAIDHLLKSNCYYAAFLPTVYTIDHSFQKLLAKDFEYCRPLLEAMHTGFKSRFEYCFNLKDARCKTAVLATCTHPFFKTRWLSSNHAMDKCIVEIVVNAVNDALQLRSNDDSMKVETGEETDDFEYYFAVEDSKKMTVQKSLNDEAVSEVQSFFDSPCEKDKNNLEQLGVYKMIREIFIKYNTILPSSVPVSRIFSFEKMIDETQRNVSEDHWLELAFLLKAHNPNE